MNNRLESEANTAIKVIELRQEIDRLKVAIQGRDTVITNLNNELKRVYRKISHGCTDANCRECDE